MRSKRIHDAYDSVRPDAQTRDRLLDRILSSEGNPPRRHPLRTGMLIAACVALLACLAAGGYAAYQKWSLPEPEPYAPTEHGLYDVHTETEYTQTELDHTSTEPLSDEDFIEKAVEILDRIGKTDVDRSKMTVTRQENLYWSRDEAVVQFTESENRASVEFNANTGALIGMTDIDCIDDAEPLTDLSAEELARRYYALLPVPQGYELTHVEQYDEQYWTHDFCRRVDENLINQYQTVRISVNPVSGRLCNLVVFDVPLLDDHEPGDVPLTQDEAEKIALDRNENLSTYTLKSAEVCIVLPNWFFSGYNAVPNSQASNVCRLGWELTYEKTDEIFVDEVIMDIDYYTGEILGGGITG